MTSPTYEDALAQGRALYPGVRIGRPGRARTYWATIAAMRVLRVKWSVDVAGSEHVAPGAAILVGNHVSAMDPVVAVMAHWWRVTAFTKVEVYEKRGGIFFRLMGQIPLRRGDNESTAWAMDMATRTLADGNKVGLYPEGTRSPDGRTMHRLHRRVLLPMLEANPDAPCTPSPRRTRTAEASAVARWCASPRDWTSTSARWHRPTSWISSARR